MEEKKAGRPKIEKAKKRKPFSVYLTTDEYARFIKTHGTINNYVRAAIPRQ